MSKYPWTAQNQSLEQSVADGRFASEADAFDALIGRLSASAQVKAMLAELTANANGTAGNVRRGTGSPEGVVTADVGVLYEQSDGTDGSVLWVKTSGSGNTGWVDVDLSAATNLLDGDGSPEGVVTAPISALYLQKDGGSGIALWVKNSGVGNTGWRPLPTSQNEVNVLDFGAVGDGSTDDAAAIALANTYAAALAGSVSGGYPAKDVTIVFPGGKKYAIATGIALSYKLNVRTDGVVLYTGSANVAAVTYGSLTPSELAFSRRLKFNVQRSVQSDWTSESNIGLSIINTYQSDIDVVAARNFTIGVQMLGDSTGCVYNIVTLGHLVNNKVGLNLTNDDTSSVGWCNENLFLGGRFANDSGVNSTLQRWGIRITSDSTVKYYNNNNVFLKPSLELNNAGSGTATPILISYGDFNHFREARQEANDSPLAVIENESKSNRIEFGYSSSALATITDDGTYPSTYLTQGQRMKLEQPSRLIFHSGSLHKLAMYSDGSTNINVPTVHLGVTSGGDTLFTAQTGLTLNADYLELSTTRAVGVFVDTRNCKEFVVRRDVTGAANGGRVAIACFNSSGTHLTNLDAGHPYVKGLSFNSPSYSASYGGVYQTGSDFADDYYFKVGTDVAYIRVLCGGGSAAPRIRSFSIFAVGQFSDCAAWTGVDEIIPGVNTGTTPPTSGTWTRGRVMMNTAPTANGVLGWQCVTAGTPGTWSPFGSTANRFIGNGTAHVAGDYALSAGWGNSASVSTVAARDTGGRVSITCNGSGIAANPTVTLTYKDGTWTTAPVCVPQRGDINAPATAVFVPTSDTATTAVITFLGTPVAGTIYTFNFHTVGK